MQLSDINKKENMLDVFNEMLVEQYGESVSKKIQEGLSKKKVLSFRVNTIKSNTKEIEKELIKHHIKYERVIWYEDAFIINDYNMKSKLESMDIYKNGQIYFQSLSSMIPPIVIDPQAGENILDMTAAPGSKTTQIAALSNNQCFITACEKNKIRAERLKYNLEKQGVKNTFVMIEDARKLDELFSFEKILLDAPCSGSGTIDLNDEKLEKNFTIELIERSSKIQLELLEKAIRMLKPGKEMVYSTCSILARENEDILIKCMEKNQIEIVPIIIKNWETIPKLPTKLEGTICVCPNEMFEGFFIANLRKK